MTDPDLTLLENLFHSKVADFDEFAKQLHHFQLANCKVYANYYDAVKQKLQMPYAFLPVELFKTNKVYASDKKEQLIFESSTTTSQVPSKHYVADAELYKNSFQSAFKLFYGDVQQYIIMALLPSYLERGHSSLVYMANALIEQTQHPLSGFYLNNLDELYQNLIEAKKTKRKILLLGVTYALLDFAYHFPIDLSEHIVMETGGMKGRGPEFTRQEVHEKLQQAFNVKQVHSEYGMTELLSQAYAAKNGLFYAPPWMRVVITDLNDPFTPMPIGKTGRINVIDLANVYSCTFIQTSDIGKLNTNGSFEVLGRIDNSEVRGCNLLYV